MSGQRARKTTDLADMLLELRAHLNKCASCRSAIRADSPDMMCSATFIAVLEIVKRWDSNITGRLHCARSGERHIFPCPDTSAHGTAYALVAEPVEVRSVVDRLF